MALPGDVGCRTSRTTPITALIGPGRADTVPLVQPDDPEAPAHFSVDGLEVLKAALSA